MEKKWEEMTAEEKREARFDTWASPKDIEGNDIPFKSPEAEAEYKATVHFLHVVAPLSWYDPYLISHHEFDFIENISTNEAGRKLNALIHGEGCRDIDIKITVFIILKLETDVG